MNQNRKILGDVGEQIVGKYLENKGFQILAYQFTTRLGEVDLIATKDEYVVFVEVKTRRTIYFPVSTVVTYSKQQKIVKSAKYFALKNQIVDKVLRFDVAIVNPTGDDYVVDYIENAFYGA